MHTALISASRTLQEWLQSQLDADPELADFFANGAMKVSLNTPQEMNQQIIQSESAWWSLLKSCRRGNNGGSVCYVMRVLGDAGNVETANIVLTDRAHSPQDTLTVEATSSGAWDNDLELVVAGGIVDPSNEFNLENYQGDASSPTERFENLSMVPGDPNFVEKVVNTSQLVRITGAQTNTNAVAGTSRSSGAPTLPLSAARTQLRININGDRYQTIIDLQGAVTGGTVPNLDHISNVVSALNDQVHALFPQWASTDLNAFCNFTASIDCGVLLLTSGITGVASSVNVARACDTSTNATGLLRLCTLDGGT